MLTIDIYIAISVPGTYWSFCPNVGAAGALLAFFLIAFLVHVAQGIYHRIPGTTREVSRLSTSGSWTMEDSLELLY